MHKACNEICCYLDGFSLRIDLKFGSGPLPVKTKQIFQSSWFKAIKFWRGVKNWAIPEKSKQWELRTYFFEKKKNPGVFHFFTLYFEGKFFQLVF